jgi:hypothetical protein
MLVFFFGDVETQGQVRVFFGSDGLGGCGQTSMDISDQLLTHSMTKAGGRGREPNKRNDGRRANAAMWKTENYD